MSVITEPLKKLSTLFGVLAHPDRLKILSLLKSTEMDVTHLQQSLGISQSGVSQHLNCLKTHGLLEQRREGKHIFYRLRTPEIAMLVLAAVQIMVMDATNDGQLIGAASDLLSLWS